MHTLLVTLAISLWGVWLSAAGQPRGQEAPPAAQGPGLTRDHVKQAQEALKMEGFHPGPVDGVVGPRTTRALRAYQAREGVPQTGVLDEATFHWLAPRAFCVQEGLAAWSGHAYKGRQTASGERFTPEAMMAAHRTLPFGTRVRVTNLVTNQATEVWITDRGPKTKEHLIDLSQAAAEQISLRRRGEALVRMEVLAPTACVADGRWARRWPPSPKLILLAKSDIRTNLRFDACPTS
jgi:rare lipoprotein A